MFIVDGGASAEGVRIVGVEDALGLRGASFTEVAFAFRVTPQVALTAVVFSLVLGLIGGALPAWRAMLVAAWRRKLISSAPYSPENEQKNTGWLIALFSQRKS